VRQQQLWQRGGGCNDDNNASCFAIGGGGTSLFCHCDGTIAVIALASLLSLQWRCCHCCASTFAVVAPALLPSLHWRHFSHCAGIVAIVAMALSHCSAGIVTHIVALALFLLL
jgi:hypothetical protein